jgi:hypothetical protein
MSDENDLFDLDKPPNNNVLSNGDDDGDVANNNVPPNGGNGGDNNVNNGNNGNGVTGLFGKFRDLGDTAKNAVLDVANHAVDAANKGVQGFGTKTNSFIDDKMNEYTGIPTTGGAEYTLSDTIMMVFIILGLLVLFYVILVESGVFGAVKTGVNKVMGGCGCE